MAASYEEIMPMDVSLRELWGQPEAVRETLQAEGARIRDLARAIAARAPQRVYVTGCGDSYYAAWSLKYAVETFWRVPCEVIQALEYACYAAPLSNERTLVIALSSSGSSRTSVAALRAAKERGAFVVGVTNTPASPFGSEPDGAIIVHATRGGWPTQASTAAMVALYLLIAEGAPAAHPQAQALRDGVRMLPEVMRATITRFDETMKEIALALSDARNFYFHGGGPSFGTAHFGMAKMKEASQAHSLVLELEEYDHIQSFALQKGEPVFLVAPAGRSHDRAVEIARKIRRNDGRLIALVSDGDREIAPLAQWPLLLPSMPEYVTPPVYVIPLQLFAYHQAMDRVARGYRRPPRDQ